MAWGVLIFQWMARVTRKTVVDAFTIHTLSALFIFPQRAGHGEAETYVEHAYSALSGQARALVNIFYFVLLFNSAVSYMRL